MKIFVDNFSEFLSNASHFFLDFLTIFHGLLPFKVAGAKITPGGWFFAFFNFKIYIKWSFIKRIALAILFKMIKTGYNLKS